MAERATKFLDHSAILVSAAELAEIIGTDLETVNNWLRRESLPGHGSGGDTSGPGCSRQTRFTKPRLQMSL